MNYSDYVISLPDRRFPEFTASPGRADPRGREPSPAVHL